ncbi:hypothetical protein [Cognatilysobacter lacus]|uniref:VOC domain-containing protein n=1 Tax=Cognatilysobacter lacus TaxID=1643323 RepID=A0A5D8ZE71_9GAMM|nr:hypothetical protein [Lysobacter lacus]TZF90954.1 hypothetical protein FW784_03355 [Lysobacter lacus]
MRGDAPTRYSLVPKVFFDTLSEALDLFVDGLGFDVKHRDGDLAVVERYGAKAYLVASPEFAARDRPELAIETDAIDTLHADIATRRPDLLHPDNSRVRRRPWGSREFAVLDRTGVCIVFRQFD